MITPIDLNSGVGIDIRGNGPSLLVVVGGVSPDSAVTAGLLSFDPPLPRVAVGPP